MTERVFSPEMMKEREKQLILALSDCAGIYCDINFTQDQILGSAIQMVDGEPCSLHEKTGMPENCRYTDVVQYWGSRLDPEEQAAFYDFFAVEQIKSRYAAGEHLICHRYWMTNVFGDRMLACHKIRLYTDHRSGDLLGITYVSDEQNYELLKKQEQQLEKQYREAAERVAFFRNMANSLPGGYHRCGTGEGFPLEFVSESFLRTVGWTKEELEEVDNKFINLVAPEDRDLFLSMEPALVQNGKIDLAYRICWKDGTRRWVQDSTMRVKQGDQEYYQCVLMDITDFVKQREEMTLQNMELTQEKNFMELMERNMPSGYHRCKAEPGCPFIYIGKYFTDLVGFSKEEIEEDFGNLYENLIWPEDLGTMVTFDEMRKMQNKGNVYNTSVYRMKHKDGGYRWVTDSTMFVDLGERSFFQGTIADITEHMESLNEAREKAEASNLAKSTFLFNASHDIRTPMNAIQGFAHMIEENADDPRKVRENVRKLKQSGDILLTLMNDILELARIERGKEQVNNRPMDLLLHMDKLNEMMMEEMAQKGINFRMENKIQHPLIMADELKLSRIAMNLLSNARKFTPSGGTVTFGVQERDFDGQRASYSLMVKDSGIGMSEDFQKRAFEQFEQERSSTESGISGSGLGLSIIKKLLDLLGGSCTIESDLGKGTTMTCTVSCEIARPEDLRLELTESNMNFNGKRILLVEDNDFNREIAHYVFEGVGFQVEEAINGVSCLEKLTRSPAGHYDVILMDIQMPLMNGYTATREIRRHSDPQIAEIPIIAMTANAFEEDKQKCLEVGMNGHIGKPLESESVLRELQRVLCR